MVALGLLRSRGLADALLPHLRRSFPQECQVLGQAQIRRVIVLGAERAASYDLAEHTARYVGLMFLFGGHFDRDPQLPWAVQGLADEGPGAERIDALYAQGIDYLGQVAGQRGQHYKRMLIRVRRMPFDTIAASDDPRALLAELHPRKAATLSDAIWEQLRTLAAAAVEQYELDERAGPALLLALMGVLGTHFQHDPLQPWAGSGLGGAAGGPLERTRALHARAIAWLDRYLAASPIDEED